MTVTSKASLMTLNFEVAGLGITVEATGVAPWQWAAIHRQWGRALAVDGNTDYAPFDDGSERSAPMGPALRIRTQGNPPVGSSPEGETAQWHTALDVHDLASKLSTHVTLSLIAALSGGPLLFHAAAVADGEGRVTGLVAKSGMGKTTASLFLGKEYGYVTDETLIVNPDLSVAPYPKPLSLIRDSGGPKQQVSPDHMGLRTPVAGLRLDRLALLVRDPYAVEPALRFPPVLEGLVRIIPETSALPSISSPLQTLASMLDRTGPVAELVYRDAAELPGLLEELSAHTSDQDIQVTALPASTPDTDILVPEDSVESRPPPTDGPGDGSARTVNGVTRLPVRDAISDGKRVLVMCGSNVALLEGLGVELWKLADPRVSVAEASAHLQVLHGPHPEAAELIRQHFTTMSAAGVVEIW